MTKKHIYPPILFTIVLVLAGVISIIFINKQWDKSAIDVKNTLVTKVTEQKNSTNLKSIIFEAQKNVVQIEAGDEETQKIGSGVLFNNKGDIITNAHVVKDAEYITVKLANAQTYAAALVGIGEEQDVALVRVPQLATHSPAQLAEHFQAEIGTEVVAVGSPLGFQNTVTLGIISGMNRTFTINDFEYENVYQISANITHGNSGGPLIDRQTGRVIAINSAGTNDGKIGFSIPISSVLDIVNQWSQNINENELVYNLPTTESIDPERIKKDAQYIVNYFFDSLSIRDYINAYALLGSDTQSKINYQDFRKDYIHVVETIRNEQQTEYLEDNKQVKINLKTTTKIRNNIEETVDKQWTYNFTIGYENDQLKILKIDKTQLD